MARRRRKRRAMKHEIPQPIIDLYDAFTHGAIDRRSFLDRLAKIAGGSAAASALVPLLANDYARASIINDDDERLNISTAKFDTGNLIDIVEPDEPPSGAAVTPTVHLPFVTAYRARLKKKKSAPAIIVIHENRGLNPHIRDVARRFALEGFDAFAVDMLSPYGGTPSDEDRAREMIGKLDSEKTALKLAAIAETLAKLHAGAVGAVGFCWGGGMVNRLAAASDRLKAGVAYYGRQIGAEDATKVKARLMLHYAGEDQRINSGIADYETALKNAGVDYQLFIYEGAQHAFNNDTNAARYDKVAADLAWGRTIAFFRETLETK